MTAKIYSHICAITFVLIVTFKTIVKCSLKVIEPFISTHYIKYHYLLMHYCNRQHTRKPHVCLNLSLLWYMNIYCVVWFLMKNNSELKYLTFKCCSNHFSFCILISLKIITFHCRLQRPLHLTVFCLWSFALVL